MLWYIIGPVVGGVAAAFLYDRVFPQTDAKVAERVTPIKGKMKKG